MRSLELGLGDPSPRVDQYKVERTTNKTFRLEIPASQLLEQEARDRNVSANTIIHELILKNLRRDRGLRAVKTVRISTLAARLLTEALSDEKIIEIGEKVASDALLRDLPFEVTGTMSPEAILQTMKLYDDCSESEHHGKKVLINAHYGGRNYSLFLATFWKTLLASVGASVKFSIDDNAVIFEFDS